MRPPIPPFVAAVFFAVLAAPPAAVADGTFLWDQSDWSDGSGGDVSGDVVATSFDLPRRVRLERVTLWIADGKANDNGVLDNFAGTLSWALYKSSGSSPGALVASGKDAAPRVEDTGFQDTALASDVARVTLRLDPAPLLEPDTYWLAVHEGAWTSVFDGTSVHWEQAATLRGAGSVHAVDETAPGGWIADATDNAHALYGSDTVLDQNEVTLDNSTPIGSQVVAVDFTLPAAQSVHGVELWLADGAVNDNGQLDNFGGTMSWAIYSDDAGPDVLLASGSDGSVRVVDTGLQDVYGEDLARASFELEPPVALAAGTYWLAFHEGAWGSAFDGTQIWAVASNSVQGAGMQIAEDETSPATWIPFPAIEVTLRVGENQIFASGFEAGGTCAWDPAAAAGGGGTCP